MDNSNAFHLPIIRAAWRIAWRERRLWPFALLAGLVIGSGIGSALIQLYSIEVTDGWWGYGGGTMGLVGMLWAQAQATGIGAAVSLGVFWAFIIAVMAVVVWAVVVSAATIILGTGSCARGATTPARIGRSAIAYAWPVFILLFFVRVAISLVTTVWHYVLLWHVITLTMATAIIGVIAFIVLIGTLSILHIATPLAVVAVVIDRSRPFQAIRDTLTLIRDRWLIIVESSCVLTVANIVGVITWIIGSFVLVLPFAFLVGIGSTRGMPWLTMTAFAVGGIVSIVFTAILSMIMTSFIASVWTMVYLRLTGSGEEPEPWLHRAVSRKS